MAGQSDAADDLIAELAKLMAQDAQDDRTAKPAAATPAAERFAPVRIPGDAAPKAASSPSADFLRSLSASDSPDASGFDRADPPREPADPVPPAEPFQFDFGVSAASGPIPSIGRAPAVSAPPSSSESPPSDAPPADHDSIADLISAELAAHPAPEPVAPPPPAPAVAVMATSVAATSDGMHAASLGAGQSDRDRFKVPPVFGLGSAQTPTPAPASEPSLSVSPAASPAMVPPKPVADSSVPRDPMEEIESLIGRAMRVEFALPEDETRQAEPMPVPAASQAPRPAPSPALRSLATPVLPNRAVDELSVADQTIFAAAQATGAKVGWVNEPLSADPEPEAHRAAPRQPRAMGVSRALAGPLVAVTLLLAAGFGLYWVLGLGGRDAGPPPLLTADAAPVKELAPVAAADDSTATQSVVFNEMDGGTPSANEQLVSRDQTDVNEVTQVAAGVDLNEEGLANRKVRTVKVRPDGTIVSGDDSVAGSAILPVDRPNVPALPGAETPAPGLLASTAPTTPVQPTPVVAAPEPTVVPVQPGSTVPAVDLAGSPIAGKSATIPLTRPTGLRLTSAAPATAETAPAPVAEADPVADTAALPIAPAATQAGASGETAPAYVQLASQRSEAEARQSAQNMVTRFGPLFGGANLEVQRVDLGARGIFYRVRVPASSLEQANLMCTNVKAAGGDCFTM